MRRSSIVLPAAPVLNGLDEGGGACASLGSDIRRAFAEAVAWDEGKLKRLGRISLRRDVLSRFAAHTITERCNGCRSHRQCGLRCGGGLVAREASSPTPSRCASLHMRS